MRANAQAPSGPESASVRGARGRHAKPGGLPVPGFGHGRPLAASTGRAGGTAEMLPAPAVGLPAEKTGGPDWREPGPAPAASPLPRRVAGQSGRVAYLAGDPARPLAADPARPVAVIQQLKVSGAPPWEPAPKPPGAP
jgi:hypothetical protein